MLLVSASFALALVAAPDAAPDAAPAPESSAPKPAAAEKTKKVCYNSTPSGSRLSRRTCVIKAAPKADEKKEAEAAPAPAQTDAPAA